LQRVSALLLRLLLTIRLTAVRNEWSGGWAFLRCGDWRCRRRRTTIAAGARKSARPAKIDRKEI